MNAAIRAILMAGVCLMAGCAADDSTRRPPSAAPNPFAVEDGPIVTIGRCVHLTFVSTTAVDVRNECDTAVAVLTAPVEIFIRRTAADHFPEPLHLTSAYASIYVAPKAVGLSSDMFRGDGGRFVYAPPGYAAVPARGSMRIPVIGADRLKIGMPAGETVVTFTTAVVPMTSYQAHVEAIDLTVDASTFNQHRSGAKRVPFRLSSRAQQVSATAAYSE